MKTFAISIPKPCHEDWNKMTPDAKGAFCASCQKSVYDFSDKTDEEIISVFEKEEEGKVCGRFTSAQLTQPVVSFGNASSTNRLAVFLYALLLAFGVTLFNGAEAFGQTEKGEVKMKMGKMAMRPVEPVATNDTTKDVKQIKRPVCGTQVLVDNKIMRLGQVAYIKEPVVKTKGDTTIEKISDLKVIETPPTIEETAIPVDTAKPIAPSQNMTMVSGGISFVEVKPVAPLLPVPPTEEKTEDKPSIVHDTIIPPVDDSTKFKSTIVPESIITPPIDLEIKVSPNPSSGVILLSYNLQTATQLRIDLFDITGKKVKTLTETGNQYAGKYNVSYNIADLPNGIYMATLLTNDRKSSAKIILTK